MTKINIFSGFLGAGKTTLIQKLIADGFKDKIALIENEFGEIAIDGGFMKEAGVEIKELNSGCICCSLVGDFETSLKQVMDTYHPERIIIEPSGVGKLSDVKKAVATVLNDEVVMDGSIAVVHAKKCKMYARNYGEFFIDQIAHADCIVLSRSQDVTEKKLQETIDIIRQHNAKAPIVTTPWDKISGQQILDALAHSELLSVEEVEAEEHETTTIMTMSAMIQNAAAMITNIIMTMTMNMSMSMSMSTITIMNMNIITITTTTMSAAIQIAAVMTMTITTTIIIITIMQMMYSAAGVWRLPRSTLRLS